MQIEHKIGTISSCSYSTSTQSLLFFNFSSTSGIILSGWKCDLANFDSIYIVTYCTHNQFQDSLMSCQAWERRFGLISNFWATWANQIMRYPAGLIGPSLHKLLIIHPWSPAQPKSCIDCYARTQTSIWHRWVCGMGHFSWGWNFPELHFLWEKLSVNRCHELQWEILTQVVSRDQALTSTRYPTRPEYFTTRTWPRVFFNISGFRRQCQFSHLGPLYRYLTILWQSIKEEWGILEVGWKWFFSCVKSVSEHIET